MWEEKGKGEGKEKERKEKRKYFFSCNFTKKKKKILFKKKRPFCTKNKKPIEHTVTSLGKKSSGS